MDCYLALWLKRAKKEKKRKQLKRQKDKNNWLCRALIATEAQRFSTGLEPPKMVASTTGAQKNQRRKKLLIDCRRRPLCLFCCSAADERPRSAAVVVGFLRRLCRSLCAALSFFFETEGRQVARFLRNVAIVGRHAAAPCTAKTSQQLAPMGPSVSACQLRTST